MNGESAPAQVSASAYGAGLLVVRGSPAQYPATEVRSLLGLGDPVIAYSSSIGCASSALI